MTDPTPPYRAEALELETAPALARPLFGSLQTRTLGEDGLAQIVDTGRSLHTTHCRHAKLEDLLMTGALGST